MSHLLLEVKANKFLNRSMFRHKLFMYDDKMVFKTRSIFKIREVTISYNHISQVFLSRGLIFGTLEIINTGGVKDIVIKAIPKGDASKAKKIIDKKIHQVHASPDKVKRGKEHVESVEKSLSRLKELLHREKINKKEYNKKRKSILEQLH